AKGAERILFSPNDRWIAARCSEGEREVIRIWEVAGGKLHATMPGGRIGTNVLAFSPDSRILATGDDDGTVDLWQVSNGRKLAEFQAPEGGGTTHALSLLFSPDGHSLFTH